MKTRSFGGLIIVAAMVAVSSYGGGRENQFNPSIAYGTFKDTRDGRTYRTVVMPDGKTWMAENLNYDTADGTGSWCYENSPDSCAKYGRLYDWNTALTACPSGWHLPSDDEWGSMTVSIDPSNPRCYPNGNCAGVGRKLKSQSGWYDDGNGTDDYGFSALPAGSRSSDGSFSNISINSVRVYNDRAEWWSATEFELNTSAALFRRINYDYASVNQSSTAKRGVGMSVRCIRDVRQ